MTALVSAMLPVGVGLLQREPLGLAGLIGLPLALLAVTLVSAGHGARSARPSYTALLRAIGAGAAIALRLVFPYQAPSDSGVAPLIIGRAGASAVTLTAAGLRYRRLGPQKPAYAISATAGVPDSLANPLFLFAVRSGGQLIGLGAAAVAVSLLALA